MTTTQTVATPVISEEMLSLLPAQVAKTAFWDGNSYVYLLDSGEFRNSNGEGAFQLSLNWPSTNDEGQIVIQVMINYYLGVVGEKVSLGEDQFTFKRAVVADKNARGGSDKIAHIRLGAMTLQMVLEFVDPGVDGRNHKMVEAWCRQNLGVSGKRCLYCLDPVEGEEAGQILFNLKKGRSAEGGGANTNLYADMVEVGGLFTPGSRTGGTVNAGVLKHPGFRGVATAARTTASTPARATAAAAMPTAVAQQVDALTELLDDGDEEL